MNAKPRLLYLGFAFPPGMQALHPGLNPAGHGFETQMVAALREHFEIRSVGVLPFEPPRSIENADPATGVAHEAILVEKAPELFHRFRSLRQFKRHYRRWMAEGWMPQAVFVYNLSPIYNNFIAWLRTRQPRPRLVLFLGDSPRLGQPMPAFRRFRHRLKPFAIPDDEMIQRFDACVGASQATQRFFTAKNIPFLWMPGACSPPRARLAEGSVDAAEPIRFGYFGSLAPYTGVINFLENFLALPLPNPVHVCGHGKLHEAIANLARRHPRLRFHGLLPTPEDCLDWAVENCDVLVNPRPLTHGNENNFPSKVFEYALCGRAILTSQMAGVDTVLGSETFYFDPQNFDPALAAQLTALARVPRAELLRRGAALRERVIRRYAWPIQAAAMAQFIESRL